MERHPSSRDLAALAAEAVPDRLRLRLEDHLGRCEHCAGEYARILSLLEPRYAGKIVPAPELRERLLRSARAGTVTAGSRSWFDGRRYGKTPVAAAAAVIVTLIAGLTVWKMSITPPPGLEVTAAYGTAHIDTIAALPGRTAGAGNRILVGPGALVELSLRPDHRIRLADGAQAAIEALGPVGRDGVVELSYRLEKGALYCRTDRNAHITYSIVTPLAVFRSIGTEFLLLVSDGRVVLIITEGRLSVSVLSANASIDAVAGKKITIEQAVTVSAADNRDLQLVEKLSSATEGVEMEPQGRAPSDTIHANKGNEPGQDISGDTPRTPDRIDDTARRDVKQQGTEIRKESREARQDIRLLRRSGKGR